MKWWMSITLRLLAMLGGVALVAKALGENYTIPNAIAIWVGTFVFFIALGIIRLPKYDGRASMYQVEMYVHHKKPELDEEFKRIKTEHEEALAKMVGATEQKLSALIDQDVKLKHDK